MRAAASTSALLLGAGIGAAHGDGPDTTVPGWAGRLNSVRMATKQYQDYKVAERDGYVNTHECVASPAGGMGVHFVNFDLMGDGKAKAHKPEVLLYEPIYEDGAVVDYELVGVEYMVVAAAVEETPVVDGLNLAMHGPMPGHDPQMPEHYDLHLWAWRENPNGILADFNPDVTCVGAPHHD